MMQKLDCRGLACPEPVIRCRKFMDEMEPADFTVLVDNEPASQNVSRFLASRGREVSIHRAGDVWEIRSGAASASLPEPASPHGEEKKTDNKKILVFLPSAVIGNGSDELGSKLMGNFLATLPEIGEQLWRVILVNGGVKLATAPGKALDSLKALEASGVTVLVCGTCLDFYGLLDKKQAGEVTNMLDIVTALGLADKVIRP